MNSNPGILETALFNHKVPDRVRELLLECLDQRVTQLERQPGDTFDDKIAALREQFEVARRVRDDGAWPEEMPAVQREDVLSGRCRRRDGQAGQQREACDSGAFDTGG